MNLITKLDKKIDKNNPLRRNSEQMSEHKAHPKQVEQTLMTEKSQEASDFSDLIRELDDDQK